MAEGDSNSSSSPGFGMKMTISMINKKFYRVKHISTDTLAKWLTEKEKELVILDCRPEVEFNVSHISGAIRVDYEDDVSTILQKLPCQDLTNKTTVCYCSAGYRSSLIADKFQEFYKKNRKDNDIPDIEIYNVEGSLFKWANEGRPMVDMNNHVTPYAHPYNAVFGKLLNSNLRKDKIT